MARVDTIINSINSNPRLASSRAFSNKVYKDEPIVRRGSQMGDYLPQRYRDMKALARTLQQGGASSSVAGGQGQGQSSYARGGSQDSYARGGGQGSGFRVSGTGFFGRTAADVLMPATRLFYEQARFMADWEDDFPYNGTFEYYYPTYSMMTDQQLRGYFSWRTKVRHGQVEETSLSFAFVYVYELLNGVGGTSALDCYRKAKAFWETYRSIEPQINRYLRYWLRDFVVYHNLPVAELAGVIDTSKEEALIALRACEARVLEAARSGNPDKQGNSGNVQRLVADPEFQQTLYSAFSQLAAYASARSKFITEHAEEVHSVLASVFVQLCVHCSRRRKLGLVDSEFGTSQATYHQLFARAVFYEPQRHAYCLYRINDVHAYSCRNGVWMAQRGYKSLAPSGLFGDVLQTIDRVMRQACGFEGPLQARALPKYIQKIIDNAVQRFYEEKRARDARRVVIDRSALSSIRATAATTRESLLTDEERENIVEPTPAASNSASSSSSVTYEGKQSVLPYGLTVEEAQLMRTLLQGQTASTAVDMLVDSINEKLFDVLGDTALEYGANGPHIIEDYREDIEGVLS